MGAFDSHTGEHGDARIGWTVRAIAWRIAISIFLPIGWLAGTLLYFGFWAGGLTFVQDLVVLVVSLLTFLAAIVAVWLSFGFRVVGRWSLD